MQLAPRGGRVVLVEAGQRVEGAQHLRSLCPSLQDLHVLCERACEGVLQAWAWGLHAFLALRARLGASVDVMPLPACG